MTYLLALAAGIAGAAIGWYVTAMVTVVAAGLLGVADFEGGRGMAAWGTGTIGGLAGLIFGVWLVLRLRGGHAFTAVAWRLPLIALAIGLLAAGVLWWMYETRPALEPDGLPPRLACEMRLPPAVTPPASPIRASASRAAIAWCGWDRSEASVLMVNSEPSPPAAAPAALPGRLVSS